MTPTPIADLVGANAGVLAIIASILGPLLYKWLDGRTVRLAKAQEAAVRRQEKLDDYARQDEVADRLAQQTMRLASQTSEVARVAAVTAKAQSEASADVSSKLDVIHTLVNSQLSNALQNELDALVREVAIMREMSVLKESMNIPPSPDALAIMVAADKKIQELRETLADRARQTDKAAAQATAQADIIKERNDK